MGWGVTCSWWGCGAKLQWWYGTNLACCWSETISASHPRFQSTAKKDKGKEWHQYRILFLWMKSLFKYVTHYPSFYDSLFREWGCITSHLALQEHRRHWVLDSYTFPLRFSIFHTCHLSKISDPAGPKLCYVTLFYQTVFANNSLGKSAVHRLAGAPHINNPTAVHTLQAMRMP